MNVFFGEEGLDVVWSGMVLSGRLCGCGGETGLGSGGAGSEVRGRKRNKEFAILRLSLNLNIANSLLRFCCFGCLFPFGNLQFPYVGRRHLRKRCHRESQEKVGG